MERSTDTIHRPLVDDFHADPARFVADGGGVAHAMHCANVDGLDRHSYRDAVATDWPAACCIDAPTSGRTIAFEGEWDRPAAGEVSGRRSDGPAGPSEKQVRFLTALLRGAGVPEDEIASKVPDSKSRCSTRIDGLLGDGVKPVWEPIVPGKPGCTPNQEAFVRKLAEERGVEVTDEMLATRASASAAIDQLKATPRPQVKQAEQPELERGDVHVVDGEYYRVHVSQSHGGFYACRWTGSGFDYERGAVRKLNADNKITAEQAAEFGFMYSACCFCSRALDTPESTSVGYGPRCAERRNLPWG